MHDVDTSDDARAHLDATDDRDSSDRPRGDREVERARIPSTSRAVGRANARGDRDRGPREESRDGTRNDPPGGSCVVID